MKERLLGKSRASQRGLKEEKYNDRRKRYHKKMRKHGGKNRAASTGGEKTIRKDCVRKRENSGEKT